MTNANRITNTDTDTRKNANAMLQKVCANWPQKLFKGGPANTLSDMHITPHYSCTN